MRYESLKEDPGIIDLINEISLAVEETTEPQDLVLCLLTSSKYWSESALHRINPLRAPYSAVLLERAGMLQMAPDSATKALVRFYREHKSKLLGKAETKPAAAPVVAAGDRKDTRKRYRMVVRQTGRIDHRGLPITERTRVEEDEYVSATPPPPSMCPAGDGGDDDDDGDDDEDLSSPPRSPIDRNLLPEDRPSDSYRSDNAIRRRERDGAGPSRATRRTLPDDQHALTTMKLALQFVSKNESKWSGPRDHYFTTEEYIRHFDYSMRLFNVSSRNRIRILPLALKNDAPDEFYRMKRTPTL